MHAARTIRCILSLATLAAGLCSACAQTPEEKRIVDLANQSRAQAGVAPLRWEAALAAAARAHAQRMAQEGPIAHRYGGEADLPERAASAGARFSLIEENIAVGQTPDQIHDGWMHSPGHHDNLLNPKIDHIGVALVSARGVLYAVADYAEAVAALTPADVESKVGAAVARSGLSIAVGQPSADARRYCSLEEGKSVASLGIQARFFMRWQSADIATLPAELEQALASGRYTQAAVGACEPKGDGGSQGAAFTSYRVAVLLY
jgi:hypothetical protein